jgi:Ulp1 family protease
MRCANQNVHHPQPNKWNWLNDDVANCFLALLQRRELMMNPTQPKVHYWHTLFYDALMKYDKVKKKRVYNFNNVVRWDKSLEYLLLECDRIVVPIHLRGLKHWASAVIHVKEMRLEYLDSMGVITRAPHDNGVMVRMHARDGQFLGCISARSS